MTNIKQSITKKDLKIIFGSNTRKELFLLLMKDIWLVPTRTKRGKSEIVIDNKNLEDIDQFIIDRWDYDICGTVIRSLFETTKKYNNIVNSYDSYVYSREMFKEYEYEDLEWPFMPGQFDSIITRNAYSLSEIKDKDEYRKIIKKVGRDAEKSQLLKTINLNRNNFFEYLIYKYYKNNIIPTFGNVNGVDYYFNGDPYDQRVSYSVTRQFKKDNKEWREKALNNPYSVAEYFLKYADESRFSNNPKFFIIGLDQDYDLDVAEELIKNIKFNEPKNIKYTFKHKLQGEKDYECPVICIVLSKS